MRDLSIAAVYPDEGPSVTGVDDVTPSRTHDATKLSLPLPVAIGMGVAMVSLVGSLWAVGYALSQQITAQSSDIRDIKTRMELTAEIDKARNEARAAEMQSLNERAEMMKEATDDLRRLTQLLQIQYQQLNRGR